MNAQRRKEIDRIISALEQLGQDAESVQNEEQEYYDNMPESLQGSDKGTAASDAADALQSAVDSIQEAHEYLTNSLEAS